MLVIGVSETEKSREQPGWMPAESMFKELSLKTCPFSKFILMVKLSKLSLKNLQKATPMAFFNSRI